MSLKRAIEVISRGGLTHGAPYLVYEFSAWYRDTHNDREDDLFHTLEGLAQRSEDYLNQEYARFLIEMGD